MFDWIPQISRGIKRAHSERRRRKTLRQDTLALARRFGGRKGRYSPETLQCDLDALGSEAARILLMELNRESYKQRNRTIFGWLFILSSLGMFAQYTTVPGFFWLVLGFFIMSRHPQKRLATALSAVLEPASGGYLAEGAWRRDKWARKASQKALPHALSGLTSRALTETKPADWPNVYKALERLNRDRDAETLVVILQNLARLNDYAAYPHVKRLAQQPPTVRSFGVRDAANQCAEELRAGYELMQQAARLLRPASAPGDDTLLRPASGVGETPADQLLRPAEPSRDEPIVGYDTQPSAAEEDEMKQTQRQSIDE